MGRHFGISQEDRGTGAARGGRLATRGALIRHSAAGAGAALMLGLTLAPAPLAAEELLFKCYFDWVCDPNRTCTDADLDLRFKVDTETNEVERLGGNPTSTFSLLLGDRGLTMLEVPISGGASTTTVQISNGWAVHSDNGFSGADLAPKQYLGECVTM